MPALLLTHRCNERYGTALVAAAAAHGITLEPVALPADPAARLDPEQCGRIALALFSRDAFPDFSRQFYSAAFKAGRLKWLHVFNAGTDHPIFGQLLERGVRLTTSSGASAEPVALTALTGMLMLARGFPRWIAAQGKRAWEPVLGDAVPPDLRGQTALLVGVGAIGRVLARAARSLGVRVLGVRRSARAPDDPVDEMHSPAALDGLLPRAQWLVLTCPLTEETHRLIDARRLALLPRGACLINVARGEIVEEPALIEALAQGRLAGAYLDVFEQEPLPAASPLWTLPNVIVSPHNAAASAGHDARVHEIFLHNLPLWARGEPMRNEVFGK